MELLQNTHTARLVLAYLYNQDLKSLAEEFCRKSAYLQEEARLLEFGEFPVSPFYRPLVQIFSEYNRMYMQLLTLIGQFEDKVSFPDTLSELEKVDMILSLNKSRDTPCLQNITNFSTQAISKPSVNVSYTSQVVKTGVMKTCLLPPAAQPFPTSPLAGKANEVQKDVAPVEIVEQTAPGNESLSMPTINLSRDELIELLMLERDKENDTALAYLLQQETIPESSCSSEKTHNRPIETKDPGPVSETVLPMTIQPALAETSNLSPVASSSINTAGPMEQPASSTCQQSRPASDVAHQTGIKEIVAARILGSMAKGGFRSGPPNDTPPGNLIVKDTASGGTRSSSSRKRSHIRILDFGTPALKRSNTKPNPGGNTEERNVEAGSTSRQLFAKQGTPSYGGDSNEPDVQIAATFAMPATSTNATMVPPGQTTHVGNSQRVQNMNPIPHLRQVEDRLHGQINVNPGLVVSQTASSSSGKTVFTSNEIQTQLVGLDEVKSSSSEKPLDVRLLSAPTSEAPKVTNNGNSMRQKTFDPKQHRVISTAEKKSRLIERTHSGTNLRTGVCLPSSQPIPSPSKPKQSSVRKSTHLREKTTTQDVVPTKHTNATLPRMVTRSSSMRMVEGDGNLSVNQITTKISKLPTKDNLPKILVPQQATMRRYESTSSLMAGEISALHTEPPETPFKFDPLNDYPMTPRFLTDPFLSVSKLDASAFSAVPLRDQPSAGRSSVVASLSETNDINTPGYPITPGALDTPKTQQSPTSAAVCYYRPDEGNVMQLPNETLPAEDPAIQERPGPGTSAIAECTGKDPDKMEIVSGDLMFVISSTPLMELFEQEPSSAS